MPKERFKVVPAVYLIIKNDNKILLSLRDNTGYMDGYYGLVSGHVDGGEPARFACIREAKEEADMILDMQDLKPSCIMHRLTPERECIDIFFILLVCEVPTERSEGEAQSRKMICLSLRFAPIVLQQTLGLKPLVGNLK